MMDSVLVDVFFGKFEQDSELGLVLLVGKDLGDGVFSGNDLGGPWNELIYGEVGDLEVLDEFDDVSFVLFDVIVVLVVALGKLVEFIFEELVLCVVA